MKQLVWSLLFAVAMTFALSATAQAASLQVQPLLYNEQIQKGEKKKGFVDISNPTDTSVQVDTSVEAFRQIDDQGSLQFFASEAVENGITPDFDSFRLGPQQTMRMMFEVDGSLLPTGDVFAALFFTMSPEQSGNVGQAIRVGTLFVLENGTPPTRQASVTELDVPLLNIGSTITGHYRIKNTAESRQATGFMPMVSAKVAPFGQNHRIKSSLVFAGRERNNQLSLPLTHLGIYKLAVSYGDSTQSRWVVLVPWWAVYGLVGLVLVILGWLLFRRLRRIRQPRKKSIKVHVVE